MRALVGPPPDTSQFVLFGWVSPPAESTTRARIDEMAGLGFNLLLPAWLDEGCPDDNLARLDWAAADGMRCLIWDSRLMGARQWLPTFEDTLNEVTAAYRDHPGLWGYYLGDEPPRDLWPLLSRLRESLRGRDPTHPGWNTLLGRSSFVSGDDYLAQLRDYADTVHPPILSDDFYSFRQSGDDPRFVENLAGLRDVAAAHGLPFWDIVLLVQHVDYRALTHGELRWEVTQCLAHGSHGIGYFTYWTPDPDSALDWHPAIIDHDGRRTEWYDFLAGFDVGVRAAGETLARSRRIRTVYTGLVPSKGDAFTPDDWIESLQGPAVVGEFAGHGGERLVLLGNCDSLNAHPFHVYTRDASGARLLAGGSAPSLTVETAPLSAVLTVSIAAGDFALIELGEPLIRPRVTTAPNPAANRVTFSILDRLGHSAFEIRDLAGRIVWTDRQPGNAREVVWDGRRTDGRRAPPGIYFARLVGGRIDFGAPREPDAAARFVWLGSR